MFIKSFIIANKQNRMIELLSNKKRRYKILSEIYHFKHLDPKYSYKIPPDLQTSKQLYELLIKKGALDICYIISPDQRYDMKEIELNKIIEIIINAKISAFISCVPGQLGYFEGENPGERYILERLKQ